MMPIKNKATSINNSTIPRSMSLFNAPAIGAGTKLGTSQTINNSNEGERPS